MCYLYLRIFASFIATLYTIYQLAQDQHFLKSVLYMNIEETWVKFFMLPTCILSSSKRKGHHHKLTSINHLCELWSSSNFEALWQHANGQVSSKPIPQKLIMQRLFALLLPLLEKTCWKDMSGSNIFWY